VTLLNKGFGSGIKFYRWRHLNRTAKTYGKINYYLYRLDPSETIAIRTRKPDATEKSLTIVAKTMTDKEFRAELKAKKDKQKEKYQPFRCKEVSKEVIACKLYSFVVEKNDIDKMMKLASAYPKLILDLRGNSGGYVFIEEYLMSHFFPRAVKIGDLVTKKKTETQTTKPVGKEEYKGEVAVLVDSRSASAAEMTARVLQIEKRARIYGDVSSGSVMASIRVPFRNLMAATTYDAAYINAGMSVTVADVIMSDGTRLERTGVIPDEALVPTAEALVERTDPLLAYVAYKFGATLLPEDAGRFFFLVPKEEEEEEDVTDIASKDHLRYLTRF
jgi:C-terminal processing protease CtpA/Prc